MWDSLCLCPPVLSPWWRVWAVLQDIYIYIKNKVFTVNWCCCVSADGPHVLLLHPAGVCGQLWRGLPRQHVPPDACQLEHPGERPVLPLLPDVWGALSGGHERWASSARSPKHGKDLSLVGTATSIIFVMTKVLSRQTSVYRDKTHLLS